MINNFQINELSPSQQTALWVILHFKTLSFYSSEVAQSGLFTTQGKKSVGAILSAVYRNGFIEKISGGRDKLWKLSSEIEINRQFYINEISKIKTYWR